MLATGLELNGSKRAVAEILAQVTWQAAIGQKQLIQINDVWYVTNRTGSDLEVRILTESANFETPSFVRGQIDGAIVAASILRRAHRGNQANRSNDE